MAPPGEKLKDLLKKLFQNPEIIALENQWNAGKASIIEGILKLKSNFPPKGEKYTDKEIREFVKYAMVTQIGFQDRDFARKIVNSRKVIDTDKFPSRKMILYSVFYKFYVDNRKPMISDAFDLIIGAPTPYMDAIVIEKHQAEIIKKVKRNDGLSRSFRGINYSRDSQNLKAINLKTVLARSVKVWVIPPRLA
ncbi:MAG: hypothetical protein R3E31_16570 [Chloroflexota bacterium]